MATTGTTMDMKDIDPSDEINDDNTTVNTTTSSYHTQHEPLLHKLLVSSSDGKIKNLLCPIELVLEASNYSAPLIPKGYDPEIFCGFQNVTSNSYRATTPKTSSRKRKNDRNINRSPKKRKKLNHAQDEDIDIDIIHTNKHSHKHNHKHTLHHPDDDFFSYQPHLNVNSRPKRQRKKVSYKEIDSNAPIPITYIQPKSQKKTIPKCNKIVRACVQQPKQQQQQQPQQPQQQQQQEKGYEQEKGQTGTIIRQESLIEMRWVQCDKCLKWRRIPTSVSESELEGEWQCSMNKWDLKRASCDAEEESYDLQEEQTLLVTNGRNNQTHREKKEEFYNNLQQFYENNNLSVTKNLNIKQLEMAKIGNRQIDFLQLYLEVTKRGGYQKCITYSLFDQVFASLSCFQSDLATKQANLSLQNLYATYLIDYERKYFYNN